MRNGDDGSLASTFHELFENIGFAPVSRSNRYISTKEASAGTFRAYSGSRALEIHVVVVS